MPSTTGQKGQVPGAIVLNWKQPETQVSSKPVTRRPMTACSACRSAKVKCNGQKNCERCSRRGLRCTYAPQQQQHQHQYQHRQDTANFQRHDGQGFNGGTSRGSVGDVNMAQQRASTQLSLSSSQDIPDIMSMPTCRTDPMSIDITSDIFSAQNSTSPSTQMNSAMDNLREETFSHALEQLDWVFPDADLGYNFSRDTSANAPQAFPHSIDSTSLLSSGSSRSPASEAQTESSNAPRHSYTQLAQQQQGPQPQPTHCQCRVNLMQSIPDLDGAIHEKPKPQVDKMFKVTGEVIRSCLEATRCGCAVTPVDLVCIMSVFEQTAVCFDFIAKSGVYETIQVGIGNYSVSVADDASLKRMLVLNLTKQADELLDTVSATAHEMFLAQNGQRLRTTGRSPACLNQLNLDYVREAIASFKKLFRLITDFMGDKTS